MSEPNKAVFLSYASQDAEAAKKICEALRVAGIEVWFDQSELRGGDAWDQKLRRQIKECALFVPIISANTQARLEGYFRLEWKLAEDRSHLMAKGRPFVVPVSVDATSERDAHVPDVFLAVQWTRLPGGEATPAFSDRVKNLLLGAASLGPRAPSPASSTVANESVRAPGKSSRRWLVSTIAGLAALVALAIWQPWKSSAPPPRSGAQTDAPPAPQKSPAALPNTQSVAVLAFADLSPEKDSEYFSDGISEELLNVLAKVPGLKVTARTSAFHFKGKDTPIPEIARQLGVAYVVEGSVRRSGNRVRITAQLIKAVDGFHVWSDNFNRDLKDIFAVQDEIAGLIAKNLSLKLGLSAPARPVDPEVFRLYLEGLQEWNRRSDAALIKAAAVLEKALALDPDFARAHAILADVWYLQVLGADRNSDRWKTAIARSEERLSKALALDPNLVEAYATRGTLLHWKRMDAAAEADFRHALALNPNSALARQRYGVALCGRGNFPAGLAELELAVRLDPLAPINASMLGVFLANARRWQEALAADENALAIDPNFGRARFQRMLPLIQLGRVAEAREIARQRLDDPERPEEFGIVALVFLARTGDPEAAKLAEPVLARRSELDTRAVLQLYLALNRVDDALAFLEQGNFKAGYTGAGFTEPIYDPIRDDPRFLRKLEEAGVLGEYREAWSHIPAAEKKPRKP